MNFRVDRWSAVALRSSLVILTTVGALLLSSCGGSGQSSQSKRFKPTRMIVFGDEASLLVPPSTPNGIDARKYTNNGLVAGTVNPQNVDCRVNLLWVQWLANEYGLVFAECNPTTAPVTAQMRAVAGGKVADVVASVDAFLASTTPVPTDLITMMVGTNDIVELYNSVSSLAMTQAAALIEVKRRGALLGAQIGRLTNHANTRGRAMYSTVPEVGLTPFGRTQSLAGQSLLNLLTTSFNDAMRGKVEINGRSNGFLDVAQDFRNIVDDLDGHSSSSVSGINIINAKAEACTPPNDPADLLVCTDLTLVTSPTAATATNYLWAGSINFSAGGHLYVGDRAVNLATSLPW